MSESIPGFCVRAAFPTKDDPCTTCCFAETMRRALAAEKERDEARAEIKRLVKIITDATSDEGGELLRARAEVWRLRGLVLAAAAQHQHGDHIRAALAGSGDGEPK